MEAQRRKYFRCAVLWQSLAVGYSCVFFISTLPCSRFYLVRENSLDVDQGQSCSSREWEICRRCEWHVERNEALAAGKLLHKTDHIRPKNYASECCELIPAMDDNFPSKF